MTDLTDLTVAEIRDGFRAGDFSAREVAEAFNANVAAAKALNARTRKSSVACSTAGTARATTVGTASSIRPAITTPTAVPVVVRRIASAA